MEKIEQETLESRFDKIFMLPRNKWKDEIIKGGYVKEEHCTYTELNGELGIWNFILSDFDRDFPYSRGDIVTLKNRGGTFVVVAMPFLSDKCDCPPENSIELSIQERGNVYILAGILPDGQKAGTFFNGEDAIYLAVEECVCDNILPHDDYTHLRNIPLGDQMWEWFIDESCYQGYYAHIFGIKYPEDSKIYYDHEMKCDFKFGKEL